MGGSISGSSRTGRRLRPITPKRISARFIIVARTGRLMLALERNMEELVEVRLGHFRRSSLDRNAWTELLPSFDHDLVPGTKSRKHLRLAGQAQSDLDGTHLGGVLVVNNENRK